MTIQEMHYDFKLKADKIDSLRTRDYLPAEIDWRINSASLSMIKKRYGLLNVTNQGFEVTQRRVDDLANLHVKERIDQIAITPAVNGTIYEAPLRLLKYKYLFTTRVSVDLSKKGCCDKKGARCKQVQTDDLSEVLRDPFHRPSFEWGEIPFNFYKDSTRLNSSSIVLYTDGTFDITSVFVEYLRIPIEVSLGNYTYIDGTNRPVTNSELAEHLHQEIIDLAVESAIVNSNTPAESVNFQREYSRLNE